MARPPVRIAALTLAAVLATQSVVAVADVRATLDAMYMSNVTPPTFAQSQLRGTLTGGSASFRTPIKSMTLYSFDLPRASAGCSGIDISGGAFSFLSKDAITGLLRQVGASMIPLLFQYALSKIDADMASQIKGFFDTLQEFGQQRLNSCKLSKGLLDTFTKKAPSAPSIDDEAQADSSNAGDSSFGGWMADSFAGAMRVVKAIAQTTTSRKNPLMGNLTWNMLADTQAHTSLVGFTDMDAARIILSLMGTTVTTCNDGNSPDGQCKATDGSDRAAPPTPVTFKATLSLNEFVFGPNSDKSLELYACTRNTTVSADPVAISDGASASIDEAMRTGCVSGMTRDSWTFNGTAAYAQTKFFGAGYDPNGTAIPDPASLYSRVTGQCAASLGSECQIQPDELRFLSSAGGDYVAVAKSLRKNPMMEAYTKKLIPYVGVAMGVRFGEAVTRVWRGAQLKGAAMPDYMVASELKLLTDLRDLRLQMAAMEPELRKYAESAAMIVANRKMQVGKLRGA